MPDSEYLKDFKAVWGDSCQSMWAELLSITVTESFVTTNYNTLLPDRLLTDMFYIPGIRGRLDDVKKDTFLQRASIYKQAIITNRIVVLSASFETYFANFLDAFIRSKPKLFDPATSARTDAGNKLYGEIIKIRGLGERISKFGELAPAKIRYVIPRLTYLADVYTLRNVLAHRAGAIDVHAATDLKHLSFNGGDRVKLTTDQLLQLAKPVLEIASSLDKKLS
ncbi:MAG: hypothetical protein PHD37_07485 [Gallionellaceae bacterium]|nr:hypothetical protein [Gallionellaceae bacterium]